MKDISLSVRVKDGVVITNAKEVKDALAKGLEEYKGMIFTEDSKAEAKKTVASLRKLKKEVNDKKLEIKKELMEPYTAFEAQVKELDKLIDEPIAFINGQVQEFERKRVEEKKAVITEIYESVIAEHQGVAEYLPLQRIYDSRWENSTTTKKTITEAVTAYADHVEKDLATIHSMGSEFEDKGIAKYKATLELSDAIAVMNQYQKQKEEILERQRKEEERRKAEAEKSKETIKAETPAVPARQDKPEEKFVEPKPYTDVIRYEVTADPFQIAQLESAMREYGIEFRRV